MFSTSSRSSKGETTIYVKDNLPNIERNDLKIQDDEFEAVWDEIIIKGGKNKMCGCIDRYPHQNMVAFNQYLDNCLKILNNENKEIYLCGDFNIDLLKIETIGLYQVNYNLLCSFGLLPHWKIRPHQLLITFFRII